jgi:hypothetical protein
MPHGSMLTIYALIPLIAWRLYARLRRMIGRQRLSRIRPWVTLLIFPLLLGLLALAARLHPQRLWFLGIGVVLGGALAVFGLAKTRFERTREGLFYTPDARLGIGLSLLLVARIVWRLVDVFVLGHAPPPSDPNDPAITPLTLGVVGLLTGYYIAYSAGLLRQRAVLLRTSIGKGDDEA